MNLSTKQLIQDISDNNGVDTTVLIGIIEYESKFNPKAVNPNPKSTAKGLIQFTNGTAIQLGYKSSQDLIDRFPDIDSQLDGPVRDYFDLYAPYNNSEEFMLAVFYPAWRKKDLSTQLPESIKEVNPGIDTLGDYVNNVSKHFSSYASVKDFLASGTGEISLVLILALGVGAYFMFRDS